MSALEEKPVKQVLVTMHTVSYLFALTALAASIAWIYYTSKAAEENKIADDSDSTTHITTAESMFEGAVISILLYAIFRHHFSESHM